MAQGSLSKWMSHAESLQNKLANIKEKSETQIGEAIKLAEVAGAAGAAGYVNAKYGGAAGELQVQGAPADLALGIAGTLAAFMGLAGRHSEHVHNLSNGLIAAYAYRAGMTAAVKQGQ